MCCCVLVSGWLGVGVVGVGFRSVCLGVGVDFRSVCLGVGVVGFERGLR